jgi:exonuclease III
MAAHLNINSLRYKFDEIKEVLTDNIVDLLIISETKLDESFNDNLFSVDGYKSNVGTGTSTAEAYLPLSDLTFHPAENNL